MFVINIGSVSMLQRLDYEKRRQYIFPLMAKVSTPVDQISFATVVVNIINENDNPPSIESSSVNISESHPIGSSVFQITATDQDGDALIYSIISGGDNKFNITRYGTVTLFAKLNFDVKNSFTLIVAVNDNLFTKTGKLHLRVISVFKRRPTFSQIMYTVSIPESTTIGSNILTVYLNQSNPPNAFTINEQIGRDFFNIDGTGKIKTSREFNYEKRRLYIFSVTVTDKHSYGHTAVIVNILDVRDICPIPTPSVQTVQLTEPILGNTIVAVVKTKDQDSKNLTFSLTGGSNVFTVDQYGGIRRSEYIDITTATDYELTVRISDGVCETSAKVTVRVNPFVPCNKYAFPEALYETSVYEGTIPSNPILTVSTGNRHSNYTIDALARTYVHISNISGEFSSI